MRISTEFVKGLLQNSYPTIKPIEFLDYVFDQGTFSASNNYIYLGVLNSKADVTITNLSGNATTLTGATNPVLFKNIVGTEFTFIGLKIKVPDNS